MIDTLQILLSNPALRFDVNSIHAIPNVAGLDIFFEQGESYTSGGGYTIDRIVRVGKTTRLNGRVNDHFHGNVGGSEFRQKVQNALQASQLPHTENDISTYFADRMSCIVIPGVNHLRSKLASTLFQHASFEHSQNWLGIQAQLSKFWQSNDLNDAALTQQQFVQLLSCVGLELLLFRSCRYLCFMPIFKDEGGTLKKLKIVPLAKERNLQRLIENNLLEVLDMRFIASEYPTTSGGRIDTLAIDTNGAPVIIEYKLGKNENVITQSLSYLRWLKAQKVEFFEMLVRRKYPDLTTEELRIDWHNPRVICIAENYTKYDTDTVEVLTVRLELFKYRYYENGILSLESLSGIDKPEERVSPSFSIPPTENQSSAKQEVGTKPASAIKVLYEELRSRIFQLDEGIMEKETSVYVAYSLQKNFAEVHFRKNKIVILLRAIEYNDPEGKIETVPETYRWTLSKRLYVEDTSELDYVMQLIEQSYKDVL